MGTIFTMLCLLWVAGPEALPRFPACADGDLQVLGPP